jgi:hypothetical protein
VQRSPVIDLKLQFFLKSCRSPLAGRSRKIGKRRGSEAENPEVAERLDETATASVEQSQRLL